jgi:T-complex protein 1 subunit eta
VIPRQVAENAGLDATDILNKLRQKHAQGSTWHGVDVNEGDVCDTYLSFVWEVSAGGGGGGAGAAAAATGRGMCWGRGWW